MSRIDRVLMGVLAVAGLAVLGIGAWVITVMVSSSDTDLERADDKCSTGKLDLETGDDGKSMRIVAKSPESIEVAGCVLSSIGAPDSLADKMQDTRGLDGRQEDTWDDFTASWTYYPDDGLRIVIEQS